ncbi:group II intron maturase-specific domain-containing protein [Legionella drancourtii]|nr:group II intron maturase-specific domain-containing protein [Legionella drancourtii]
MQAKIHDWRFYRRTEITLNDIAKRFNPVLRGWIEYYGRYNRSSLYAVFRHFNKTLVAWAMRKYRKLNGRTRAIYFLENIAKRDSTLFVHWKIGMIGAFA